MISRLPKVKWADRGYPGTRVPRFSLVPTESNHNISTVDARNVFGSKLIFDFWGYHGIPPFHRVDHRLMKTSRAKLRSSRMASGASRRTMGRPATPRCVRNVLFLLASFHTFPGKTYHKDSQSHKKQGQTYNTWPNTSYYVYVTSLCHTLPIFVSRCWLLT